MKAPIGWLRDYVDLRASTDEIVERLAMLGFPVESVERRPHLSGVVVGRIVALSPHPNADRLQVASVDVGAAQQLVIATAATNVAAGQTVPVATAGAQLVRDGSPLRIEARRMRGVDSAGMLCSADELGFPSDWFEDGILQLEPSLKLGTDVIEHFRLGDDVLDVEITANRVDAMCMVGLARELGAAFGLMVRAPVEHANVRTLSPTEAKQDGLVVRLESEDCYRFVAQRFDGVAVRPAPAWMRLRLALAGQRPINNLVDIGNFVMLELGQPQHVYDVRTLAGPALIARNARSGERILTLDGEEFALDERALVIADERQPQGIAGVMGAASSEVAPDTTQIVVESASFAGPRIRRMSKFFAKRTEASSRQERGLPLEFTGIGAARAAQLLEVEGARARQPFAVGATPAERAPIDARVGAVQSLIGIDVSAGEMERALQALGFTMTSASASDQLGEEFEETLRVTPPYWRRDVAIPADVAEEVARIVGYDRIEAVAAPVLEQAVTSDEYLHERAVAHAFACAGYREVMTLSLQPRGTYERFRRAGIAVSSEPVEILNPLSEDQRYLRFSLVPALLELAARHGAAAPLRMFELGHVFERAEPAPFEIPMAAWMYVAEPAHEPPWHDAGFRTFKGEATSVLRAITGREADTVTANEAALHRGKTASLVIDGRDVATIGAVDPRLLAAYEIDRPAYIGLMRMHDVPAYRVPAYRAPSRYPAVERDLAIVVAPDVAAHEIAHAIRSAGDGIVRDVRVFDEYRGPQIAADRKSIAVRVRFQRDDATLTDAEVEKHLATILDALRDRVGAHIRG